MDWILLRSLVLLEHLAVLTKSASQNHPQVKNWNHICQNVPVDTARYWAAQVLDFCNDDLEDSGANFVKQDNIKQDVVLKDMDDDKVGEAPFKMTQKAFGHCPYSFCTCLLYTSDAADE